MGTIKIKIWPDGNQSEIKVEGVTGISCEELTKNLEEAVLQAGSKKEYTPEYYMEDQNVLNQRI
jgi:beta-lactam-binding protein with PASTA domain